MTIIATDRTADIIDAEDFAADWKRWHDDLEEGRRAPHGFLAYTSFNLLDAEFRRFDDLPGAWSTGADGPVVDLADGESLEIDGHVITGRHEYGVIGERTFHRARFGESVAELSRRGGRDIVRPLRPDHGLRQQYRGTPAYAPDPRWVIQGAFEPADKPHNIAIAAAIPVIEHTHTTPGRVRFSIGGETYALTLISRGPGEAMVLFRDATSGVTTYGASRTLAVSIPEGAGPVTLDFNRATNLQCAYTDYSPCPLAPAENRLPFAVEAGEQIPLDRTS
jgi:hypothetical protein